MLLPHPSLTLPLPLPHPSFPPLPNPSLPLHPLPLCSPHSPFPQAFIFPPLLQVLSLPSPPFPQALAIEVKEKPKNVVKKTYEETSAILPDWVTKIYETIARDGERAQKNRDRLTHLLELRLDQDDDTLNFLAVTRIVREARSAGVDPMLITKAEYRLAEIAPEIKLFGVAGLCDGCTGESTPADATATQAIALAALVSLRFRSRSIPFRSVSFQEPNSPHPSSSQ